MIRAMRAVCQRVSEARVRIEAAVVAEIGPGLVVLLGVGRGDTPDDPARLAAKIARLRIFEDAGGRFDCSLLDSGGSALVVSQFTLLADTRRGNRPSFADAAPRRKPSRCTRSSAPRSPARAFRCNAASSEHAWQLSSSTTGR
jgi:D-aminoacyl-tRNA deacylase